MNTAKQNKEFILTYYNAISGTSKPVALCEEFIKDQKLIDNILFWDAVFPKYELFADELIAEGNRVVVRARMKGKHEGAFKGIPPTFREIELPFVIGYEVEGNKIVGHWLVADQILLMEQLGIAAGVSPVETEK